MALRFNLSPQTADDSSGEVCRLANPSGPPLWGLSAEISADVKRILDQDKVGLVSTSMYLSPIENRRLWRR